MGNKPSGVARNVAGEAEIADGRKSAPSLSKMDIVFATIARLNPANRSAPEHGGDDTEASQSGPDHLTDRDTYPVITCSTRFDSLSETSSYISNYMDRLPLAPTEDVGSETNAKPDVDNVKAMFFQLESRDKIELYANPYAALHLARELILYRVQEFLESCDNHDWFDTLAKSEVRELRFDILGNLPAELVHRVGDYLDPEDIVRSVVVSSGVPLITHLWILTVTTRFRRNGGSSYPTWNSVHPNLHPTSRSRRPR